ncbi:MAG: nucleotidyltransferase substrate binding protein [Nitrospinota bacterium]|nr:nucleotidyltransferase substrate binding protein [Nitrospinota bacterium]
MTNISPSEPQVLLTHFNWNLQRLEEVIKQEQTDYFRGAALQRFGHTYDITIKIIRSFAKYQDLTCQTDEQCFEIAVTNGWMEKVFDINEMINDYQNITQKPQQNAENIYKKLTTYHRAFSYLFKQLKKVV